MKEKVKIWSRRRLLGAFLAFLGLSAVATAQNGTPKANCNTTNVVELVRTVDQMDSTYGTVVTLNFGAALKDYKVYVVAETNGTINSMETPSTCAGTLGDGVKLYGATPANYVDANGNIVTPPSYTGATNNSIVPGAAGSWVTIVDEFGKARINVGDNSPNPANGTYEFGVFLQEPDAPGCFSDVHIVRITVTQNVYASLVLNGEVGAHEYICSGDQTNTNIGFNVCGIPAAATNVTLHYTLKLAYTEATPGATTVEGDAVTGMTFNTVAMSQSGTEFDYEISNYTSVTVGIGQQTLTNTSSNVANTVEYTFLEGIDKFYISYESANGTVVLPILFKTADGQCTESGHTDALSHTFTVHVAPAFTITPLQYADDARTTGKTEFCQGTIAYLNTTTSATEGKITDWVWTVDAASTNADEAKAKFFPAFSTSDPIQAAITGGTGVVENTAKVGELTKIEEGVYKYDLVATWNDDGNHYTGCTANADIDIVVTPAPILLLATDQAEVDGIQTWNATNKITASVVCPGNPILMATNDEKDGEGNYVVGFAADDADARTDYMDAGNYIRANGNTLKYTVSPYADPAGDVAAYTDWRTTAAAETGELPLVQTDGTTPGHFLNNSGTTPANIIYTVENNDPNGCKLVKSDGSSLNLEAEKDGKVQIIFPVQPRPKFNLSAN